MKKAFSLIELSIAFLIVGVVASIIFNSKSIVKKAECFIDSLSNQNLDAENQTNVETLAGDRTSAYENCVNLGIPNSCKQQLTQYPTSSSGAYEIDPDGPGGNAPFYTYCDMTSVCGGLKGWTLVVAQYEDSPVANWNPPSPTIFGSGNQITAEMLDNCGNSNTSTNGCDQTQSNGFVLSTSQIPDHTHTAFGKGSDADFIGCSSFSYTTDNIPLTTVSNLKTSSIYQIFRNDSSHYINGNPEETIDNVTSATLNSLTYDGPGAPRSWLFLPLHTTLEMRGSSMNGTVGSSNDSFAWTVWIR